MPGKPLDHLLSEQHLLWQFHQENYLSLKHLQSIDLKLYLPNSTDVMWGILTTLDRTQRKAFQPQPPKNLSLPWKKTNYCY